MNNNIDLEAKRKKIETVVKVASLLVISFFVAPFIFVAIKGLVGLVVAGVVALVAINLAPAAAALIANWRLKALKAVAAANPIEELENQYGARQSALAQMRDNIKQSYAVLQDLYSQIQEYTEKYPGKECLYQDKYVKLKALIELRGRKYKEAQAKLAQFAEVIEEKRQDWKIAQTMAKASKLANVGEDFQSTIMKDTALTTIQDGLNMAFSELETSLLDDQPSASSAPQQISTPTTRALPDKLALPALDLGSEDNKVIEAEVVPAKKTPR